MLFGTPQLNFMFGCIPARLLLVAATKYSADHSAEHSQFSFILGLIMLVMALGFLTIYIFDLRKEGPEADGKIWWNHMRPLHGSLYLASSIMAMKGEKLAYIPILIDTFIGFGAFVHHRYIK